MTTILFWLGGLLLISLLVHLLLLWGLGAAFRLERATLLNSAKALGLMVLGSIPGTLILMPLAPVASDYPLVVLLLSVAVQLFVIYGSIRWVFRTRWPITIGIGLLWSAIGGVAGIMIALGFRSTIAEAFVIPTGSMAPTLYGLHAEKQCNQCGWQFAASLSHRNSPSMFDREAVATCDNCGTPIRITSNDATVSGDRIFVTKRTQPKRWDLIVYQVSPHLDSPYATPENTNYVHRLIGLPGEEITIRGGEVAVNRKILRKAPGEFSEFWLPVYDTSFSPVMNDTLWKPADEDSQWRRTTAGVWSCTPGKYTRDELEYSRPIIDTLSYNTDLGYHGGELYQAVSDVRVDCQLSEASSDGQLVFTRQFGRHLIRISVSQEDGIEFAESIVSKPSDASEANIERVDNSQFAQLPNAVVSFAVRDGWAYVLINEQLAGEVALKMFDPDDAKPDGDISEEPSEDAEFADNPSRVTLMAVGGGFTLDRIRLRRDVYFLTTGEMESYYRANSASERFVLGNDDFFVLGDNSRNSKDSRFSRPVTRNTILGVARGIYWPPKRWRGFP